MANDPGVGSHLGLQTGAGAIRRGDAETAIASFDGRAAFSTWLYRIAYTTFLNHLRRPRRIARENRAKAPHRSTNRRSRPCPQAPL